MEFTTILDSRKSIRTYTGEPISEGFTPTCSITLGKTNHGPTTHTRQTIATNKYKKTPVTWRFFYKTITKVPAPINTQPISDLVVNSSCKNANANTKVITTLSLSIGTTLDASPI